ncbi:MAG: Sarcosine oxidase subunit beta [Alphaproteobacteria bacterium MarineAlpha5_Bin11]|nr:sarcosine oxidase subunit beta [Pelagibacteraceae bacterium]PPR44403.1 MAG: Sarcosine oxidase subunit beta [Alphaproteobacteria bacterium MarineAlpha5_Bin11]PPR50823.1 MAG: Sarcosine oxidase subunit beta [Alphaproteobacteria bacterium MarineAlpha5_Bin10]|tara:strand:+ start:15510 stop:16778 length:1269 start_codon:yes stop_codon:yes gene_type:complete
MTRFNAWNVLKNGFINQTGWQRQWRDPVLKKEYDVVIVGAGLHGLATAYYLAKNHKINNIAVLEKGWLGGGNAGRNTTIVRSNYMMPGNHEFYEHSLKLWENLSHELNYNVMFSQRAHVNLFHSPAARDSNARRYNTMLLHNTDAEFWNLKKLKKTIPHLNYGPNARFPIMGAAVQKRAGTARHDAVAWGYARAADSLGVDIIQNCEVNGFVRRANNIDIIETSRGQIKAKKVGFAVAGNTSRLWQMAGLDSLPIESHKLQAFVTEPLKPILDQVVVFGVGGAHFYISQSDKGGLVFGGDLDWYKSYAQRGNLPIVQDVAEAALSILPCLGRVRLLRHWSGIMDMTMDGSFFICKTPIDNLYLNAGWNYGGFKTTPASGWHFADLIANNRPNKIINNHDLKRFEKGVNIDERGAGPDPKLHG